MQQIQQVLDFMDLPVYNPQLKMKLLEKKAHFQILFLSIPGWVRPIHQYYITSSNEILHWNVTLLTPPICEETVAFKVISSTIIQLNEWQQKHVGHSSL